MTDASSKLGEHATYCRPNDNKRPELVGLPDATTSQICPVDKSKGADEVTNAYPDGWFVRVMFDELLDPNIEALVDTTTGMPCDTTAPDTTCSGTIAASHPVDLKCHSVVDGALTSVSYDGYYSPAGNAVTWPLGPSLVIKPNDPAAIATNTECEVTLNGNITDKDGNPVPMDERGPYKFKVAPITAIAMDPPVDDPDYKAPIDALTIYLDNPYVQFNTTVDPNSICPDADADGNCDDDSVFSLTDVAHPTEGPGRCNKTLKPCGSMTDCDTAGGDTVCGKGLCGSSAGGGSTAPCNKASDCTAAGDDICNTMYAYNYVPYGATDTEFGMGPIEPVETEHKYIFSFTAGAKLKDRCGASTTLPTPTADNLLLAHFITNKFDFNKASIATGETASAMKRLTYTWNNVLTGSDFTTGSPGYTAATGQAFSIGDIQAGGAAISPVMSTTGATPAFTVSPTPKKLTAACAADGSGCTTADLAAGELLIVSPGADGQVMLQGHLQMNTEYTATIKAGTVIKDFYGKSYTQTSDSVIKWKTAPAIAVTSIGVRQPGTLVNIADKGTVTMPTPTTTIDIRIGFNASMDAKTLDASEVSLEAADTTTPTPPTLSVVSASGCGNFQTAAPELYNGDNRMGWIGSCSLRVRGLYKPGNYKFTIKKDASFKDIFGTVYTQAADQSITFTVKDAPAPVQCL